MATNHKKYDEAKKYKQEVEKLTAERDELTSKWRHEKGVSTAEVQASDVAQVVSSIPVNELTEEEKAKLQQSKTSPESCRTGPSS